MMRFTRTSLATLLLVAAAASTAHAQDSGESRFSVTVEPRMTRTSLIDLPISVFEYYSRDEQTDTRATRYYGFNEADIRLPRSYDMGLRLSAQYALSANTDLSLILDSYKTSSSRSLTVESALETLRFCRMWDALIFPVTNLAENSGYSSVDCNASDEFSSTSAILQVNTEVWSSGRHSLDAVGGLALTAHRYNASIREELQANQIVVINDISLWSETSGETKMVGPSLGIDYRGEVTTWLAATASARTQYFYARTDYTGLFRDVDDIDVATQNGGSFQVVYTGTGDYSSQRESWVSAKSLRVGAEGSYRNLTASMGADVRIVNDMPLAPTLHNPWGMTGASKAPPALQWKPQARTVPFTSLYIQFSWNF